MSAADIRCQVAVVGAGAMGAGIAQVAAAAGHTVWLLDARAGAAGAAHARIGDMLAALVARERLGGGERDAILSRIRPVAALHELAGAAIVIEAIVEDLDAKRKLLRELEAHVAPDAMLASNTSTISVTALALGLRHAGRLVGMHFFNPVPQMKLVEVISGDDTSPGTARAAFELAGRWGKVAVHARSTPGFIVNRIARPFYAEALLLLQEQASVPAVLDRLARAAGFRMGPCELMDLIGHDVNLAVTQSVFDATYGDGRFQPSPVQRALVDGGRLGRKSGQGFYGADAAPQMAPVAALAPARLQVHGASPLAGMLARQLTLRGIAHGRVPRSDWNGLLADGLQLHLSDGRPAARVAAECRRQALAVIDWPLSDAGGALAIAYAPGVAAGERDRAAAMLAACGWQAHALRDVPGLLIARTVAMLVNEAADAVWQGVCEPGAADQAMRLGTNYPAGPFEWLEQVGADAIVALLDHMYHASRNERYRVSPLLQERYWTQRSAA